MRIRICTYYESAIISINFAIDVVADKEVKQGRRRSRGKKSKKGEEAGDVATMVSQLRTHLLGEEVKVAVTAPVKETGRALLNMGQRFSSWISSLVKS